MHYFDLFNIATHFNIDIHDIKAKYLVLQSKFHPDKAKNDFERLKFLEFSITINNAYKILIDNYARAQYILKLNNIDLDNESTTIIDQNILLQVLEDCEILENLENLIKLQQLQATTNLKINLLTDELNNLFAQNDFLNATTKTIELKYQLKFLTTIQSKISKLYATSSNN